MIAKCFFITGVTLLAVSFIGMRLYSRTTDKPDTTFDDLRKDMDERLSKAHAAAEEAARKE